MLYKFSKLISSLRTQAQFDQWVESRKAEIKEKAYDKRHVIDKRSLQHELDSFDSLKKAYKPLKKLRRKSGDYDAAIVIDDKGYTSFRVYFPVSQEELDAAADYRRQRIAELGRWGSICISPGEALWSILHEKIYEVFSFTRPVTAIQNFEKYGSPLVRKMDIFGFK